MTKYMKNIFLRSIEDVFKLKVFMIMDTFVHPLQICKFSTTMVNYGVVDFGI